MILLGLLSFVSTSAFAFDLTLQANAPVCFGAICSVTVNFTGLEKISPDLFQEIPRLESCGRIGKAGIAIANRPLSGKSRIVMIVRSDRGLVEKNCNLATMPQFTSSSLAAFRTFYFPKTRIPQSLKITFRDRLAPRSKKTFRVNVPPQANPATYTCDRHMSTFSGGRQSVFGFQADEGKVHTICFDIEGKDFPLFETYTINNGNSSCSDLLMRAISPDGQKVTSDLGPAPVVRPQIMAGMWKLQVQLMQGCSRYDFHVSQ